MPLMQRRPIMKEWVSNMKQSNRQIFTQGLIKDNPVFVGLLGLIPALAVTHTVETSLGMGIIMLFVLLGSTLIINLTNRFISDKNQLIAYVMIVAMLVSVAAILTEAFAPLLFSELGIYLPLLAVSTLVFHQMWDSKSTQLGKSLLSSLSQGIGFILALLLIGLFREVISTGGIAYGVFLPLSSSGSFFNASTFLLNQSVFNTSAGGFIVIGVLLGIVRKIQNKGGDNV
jgi:electron transport complex protein RnfE